MDAVLQPHSARYIFVGIDRPAQGFRTVNGTRGMRELLKGTSDEPHPLPPGLVDALVEAEKLAIFDATRKGLDLPPGTEMRFVAGPFYGLIARVKSAKSKDRVSVLLSAFGRPVVTTVPLDWLERI